MRRSGIALAILVVSLAVNGTARAGVYSTTEPPRWPLPVDNFREFTMDLANLRGLRAEKGTLFPRYKEQKALLEAKKQAGALSAEDRINLSYYLIYLDKPEEAAAVLEAIPIDKRNFMALANLATAHHQAGQLARAVHYQEQLLKNWPPVVLGWTPAQQWYARVEKLYLRLLQSRYQESVRSQNKGTWDELDPLFPGVKFVGPSGQYEAGQLALDQWLEIPPDAVPMLIQLVFWLPNDDRVFWQLGELLNAKGNIGEAEKILDDLVYARNNSRVKELRRHRQILGEAKAVVDEIGKHRELLCWALLPRGVTPVPGVGPLASECVMFLPTTPWARLATESAAEAAAPPSTPPASPAASWMPSWRDITVGFIAGIAITFFVQLQWRESRRRRAGMAAAPGG